MAGDWIKLHRKLLSHPIMTHDGLCRLWVHCLMRANWKDKQWIIPGTLQPITILRGSFITGRESLFSEMYPKRDSDGKAIVRKWAPTSRTLWSWLRALEGFECVKLETVSNRCTIVTIRNYNTYQSLEEGSLPAGFPLASSQLPAGFPLTCSPASTIEERKEFQEGEESKEGKEASCSETAGPSSKPEEPPAEETVEMVFPCDGKRREWPLLASQVAEWRDCFPHLDVMASCREALGWVHANPQKRKTHDGMKRFLFSWLKRDQNGGKHRLSGSTAAHDPSDFMAEFRAEAAAQEAQS